MDLLKLRQKFHYGNKAYAPTVLGIDIMVTKEFEVQEIIGSSSTMQR
jgi:hypothetical protein